MELFNRKITKDQSKDTGMAMVLLLLLLDIRMKREGVLVAAILLHVVNMTAPRVYAPLAVLWFGLSDLLSTVVSKILLSVLFFGVVTPIAILRKLFGKDSLQLRAFRASRESVMSVRNHQFAGRDIEKPY
jgi:ABC-type nitrate/sulfonate/bicarbonate transport system permease component